MKLICIFLVLFLISDAVLGKHAAAKKNEHHNSKKLTGAKKRSRIADESAMPTLNDLPADTPEMVSKIAKEINSKEPDQDLPGSYGEGGIDEEAETKSTITKKVAENAAHFGNNVKVKPGINPSAAFIVKEGNHKGFRGKDKTVGKKRTTAIKESKDKRKLKSKKLVGKQKNLHKEDQDIVKKIKNIAKEIDIIEKKKKKEVRKMKKKLQTTNAPVPNNLEDKDASTKNSHGVVGENVTKSFLAEKKREPGSFECPWSCYWTCQSYCPKECCDNPYNCALTCREICSPYCNDRCCAPGARRLPKLHLPFLTQHARGEPHQKPQPLQHPIGVYNPMLLKPISIDIKDNNNNFIPQKQPQQHRFHLDPQIGFKIKQLKEQSDYAAKLLGLSHECPSLCSKICTPIVCHPHCCAARSSMQQRQYLQNSPYPAIDAKTLQTVNLVQNARAGIFRDGFNKPVYCRSPRNCPPGGIVDPEYCPPICRSSCIQQCPNECCPNFGQASA